MPSATTLPVGLRRPFELTDRRQDLLATERLVERARVIKDAAEIEVIREGARRISAIARRLHRARPSGTARG